MVKIKENAPKNSIATGKVSSSSYKSLSNHADTIQIDQYIFKRMFQYAGKHEERHKQYGLHLIYYLVDSLASKDNLEKRKQELSESKLFDHVEIESLKESGSIQVSRAMPKDSLFRYQWNFFNTGQSKGRPGADIGLINAQKIEKGRKSVIVSVHDSGFDSLHRDLIPNLWINEGEIPNNGVDDDDNGYIDDIHGWNFAGHNNDLQDRNGHGTFIAGLISAKSDRDGMLGIAGGDSLHNGIQLMICRMDNDDPEFFISNPQASIVYAADNGSIISSNSWNSYGYDYSTLQALKYYGNVAKSDLIDTALVVFGAGNSGFSDRRYETEDPHVMMVGSTNHKDSVSSFSNYGTWLDICAPGEDVLSQAIGGGYRFWSGTSFAAPHLAGVAALVLSKYGGKNFTFQQLKNRIKASADNIDQWNQSKYHGKVGAGRINVFKALIDPENQPPDVVEEIWVSSNQYGWIEIGLKTPYDNTIAPFKYSIELIDTNNNSSRIYDFEIQLPNLGDSVFFRLDSIIPNLDYSFRILAIDYFGNVSDWSKPISFTSIGRPELVLDSFQTNHTFKRDTTYTTQFAFRNDGEGDLNWMLSEKLKDKKLNNVHFKTIKPENDLTLKDFVTNDGGIIEALDSNFYHAELLGVNVLILNNNIHYLDSIKIQQIRDWVSVGGKAIVTLGEYGLLNANRLLDSTGISYVSYGETFISWYRRTDTFVHPILEGVESYSMNYYDSYLNIDHAFGVNVVLDDEFDHVHIATTNYGLGEFIVVANSIYSDTWIYEFDNPTLIKNILYYAAKNSIISFQKESGSLLSGTKENITLRFNPNLGPSYSDSLFLYTNDPDKSVVKIPYRLNVRSRGVVKWINDDIKYDSTYIGYDIIKKAIVVNIGLDDVKVDIEGTANFILKGDYNQKILTPGDSLICSIQFSPNEIGIYNDEVKILWNNTLIKLPVSGIGVKPPHFLLSASDTINVTYDQLISNKMSLSIDLSNGDNAGDLRLNWNIKESPRSKRTREFTEILFSGKIIGVTNYNYYKIALNQLPIASENSFIPLKVPLSKNNFNLDTLDVIILDEQYSDLKYSDIELVKTWVSNGGRLFFQPSSLYDMSKLSKILDMTSAETYGTYPTSNYDTLQNIYLHPITEGIERFLTNYRSYIEYKNTTNVLIRNKFGDPYLSWDTYGSGKVILCANNVFVTTSSNLAYLRMINQSFNWFFNKSESWITSNSLKYLRLSSGESNNIEIEISSKEDDLTPKEAILGFHSNDPDSLKTVVITLGNPQEFKNTIPTLNLFVYQIKENAISGANIGILKASDLDGDKLYFGIKDNNSPVSIDLLSGLITVRDSSFFDYEKHPSNDLHVYVTDKKDTLYHEIKVILLNENEAPNVDDLTFYINENSVNGTIIDKVVASDPESNMLVYSIIFGNEGDVFHINSANGKISVKKTNSIDYESQSIYHLVIGVADFEFTTYGNVDIHIINVNEAPVVDTFTFFIKENSATGIAVGTIEASDPEDDVLSFDLVSGNDLHAFALDAVTGVLSVSNNHLLDFERESIYKFNISITDGEFVVDREVTINVIDINEPPSSSDFVFSIKENSATGIAVGTIEASDPEDDVLSFDLVSGNDLHAFALDAVTGVLSVNDNHLLDFETTNIFDLVVSISDMEYLINANIVVHLIDLDDNITDVNKFSETSIIYPNPVTDYLNIDWLEYESVVIHHISGTEVLISNENRIDVKGLASGIYVLTINGRMSKRHIKILKSD